MEARNLLQLWITVVPLSMCMGQLPDYFVQVGDIHIDPKYPEDGGLSCNKDIPLEDLHKNGHYECDLPIAAFEKALTYIREQGTPEFVLWTGDNVYAPKINGTYPNTQEVKDILNQATDVMKQVMSGVNVVPLIGNHDYHPVSQLPGDAENDEIYDYLAEIWADWLPANLDTFKRGAFYSTPLADGLRGLVVNTNLYLIGNSATEGQSDPGSQFEWINAQLIEAEQQGEKVFMFMHVPPGAVEHVYDEWMLRTEHATRLIDIVGSFSEVITAIFSAHEHTDAFRIIYENRQPVVPLFISPALTPRIPRHDDAWGRNSAIRRVSYDRNNFDVLNIEQYALFLNETLANQEWKNEYHFKTVYLMQNMTAAGLHDLVQDMYKYGSEKFHLYYGYNQVSSHYPKFQPAGCRKKQEHLCAMHHLLPDAYRDCVAELTACDASRLLCSMVLLIVIMAVHWLK